MFILISKNKLIQLHLLKSYSDKRSKTYFLEKYLSILKKLPSNSVRLKRTSVKNIYASGDVIDKKIPKLTPTAEFESNYIT